MSDLLPRGMVLAAANAAIASARAASNAVGAPGPTDEQAEAARNAMPSKHALPLVFDPSDFGPEGPEPEAIDDSGDEDPVPDPVPEPAPKLPPRRVAAVPAASVPAASVPAAAVRTAAEAAEAEARAAHAAQNAARASLGVALVPFSYPGAVRDPEDAPDALAFEDDDFPQLPPKPTPAPPKPAPAPPQPVPALPKRAVAPAVPAAPRAQPRRTERGEQDFEQKVDVNRYLVMLPPSLVLFPDLIPMLRALVKARADLLVVKPL